MSDEPTELQQIQQVLRTDPPSYWRDPGMQTRLGELLAEQNPEAGEGMAADLELVGAGEAQAGLQSMGPACAELVAEWESVHAFPQLLRNTQNAVVSIVGEFSEREQRAFFARFDELPEKAIAGVYRELSMGKPNYIPEAGEAALEQFAGTPEGSELVREWGHSAARRVGVVKARWARAAAAMGTDAYAKVQSWFNGLETNQAKAILRELGR